MKTVKKVKRLKSAYYKGRLTEFRKLVSVMTVVGILFSAVYFCRYTYTEYAAARADIVLTYPEIAQSKYPDGSRFTYHEFISDENLKAALDMMKAEGKYVNFTVKDIKDKFFIYSYLENSAGDSVSSARSEGNDFSYVANEYKITFIQPHDYKNKNIIRKFFTKDYSADFLKKLVEVNRNQISRKLGGSEGFIRLSQTSLQQGYDYNEEISIYRTKVDSIMAYLKFLKKTNADFVSKKHDLSLHDLEGRYRFLIENSLNGISDFIESSAITKDLTQTSNKLKVNIENNTLKCNQYMDKSSINNYAMINYDQTFTENLINVVQNEKYGLYQARPKTAFDTVVVNKHDADENIAQYTNKITKYNDELYNYTNVVQTPEEHTRLAAKCEKLMASLRNDYAELTELTREIVDECYITENESYLSAKVKHRKLLSKSLAVKLIIVFMLGAVLAFVCFVFLSTVRSGRKIKKKKELIDLIKQREKEKESKSWDF